MPKSNVLKSNVPGWGIDLDPRNRPGVPREKNDESVTDARSNEDYERIPQQEQKVEILLSSEHKRMTPIFGTACPPHGLSGMIRRFAFRFSEGQKTHWVLLLFADRVDMLESALSEMARGRYDNLFKETGLRAEFRKGGFSSRFHHDRADTKRWGQQALLAFSLVGVGVLIFRSRRR